MSKKIYSIPFFILITLNSFAQNPFQRLIGGTNHERAQTVFSTFDSLILVNSATGSYGSGGIEAMLIKLDAAGNTIWSKTIGTPGYDNFEYACETNSRDYILAGRSESVTSGPTHAWLVLADSSGNPVWAKSYGGTSNDGFNHVIQTADLSFAAIGYSNTLSSGASDILFIKADANGDTIFTRAYGSVETETGTYVGELLDGGFILSGRQTTMSGTKGDGILIRTDSLGNVIWSKMYGDTLFEELTAVRQTSDGGFIAVGSTTGYGSGGFDILLMKTDSAGNVLWSHAYGGASSDAGYDIHITADNGFILSGFTESLGYGHRGNDGDNIYLLKTDSLGAVEWMEVYGDGLQDEAYRSNIAIDGGYLVGGFTKNYLPNDSSQIIVIRADINGLSGCHEEAVVPADSIIAVLFVDTTFTQLSGLPFANTITSSSVVSTFNDDACIYLEAQLAEKKSNTLIYPNPFYDKLTMNAGLESDIQMIDVTGRVCIDLKNVTGEKMIDTSQLTPGIYFVTIYNGKSKESHKVSLVR